MTEFEEHRFDALETFEWLPLEPDLNSEEYWQNVDFVVRSVTERKRWHNLPKLAATAGIAYHMAM